MSFASSDEKTGVVEKFRINGSDTGSPEVQIALLTKRLERLTDHFKSHPKDAHSKRGMLRMVSRRKKLLQYLMNEDVERYRKVIGELGLRK